MNVLSTTFHDCVKLWALYPPTKHNLDLFYQRQGQESKFRSLFDKLECARFVVTTNGDTLYLPSGWLHAVVTVRSGYLAGINWNQWTDITTVSTVARFEASTRLGEAEVSPLITCCRHALQSSASDAVITVFVALCKLWQPTEHVASNACRARAKSKADKSHENMHLLRQIPKGIYREILQKVSRGLQVCTSCGKPVQEHFFKH